MVSTCLVHYRKCYVQLSVVFSQISKLLLRLSNLYEKWYKKVCVRWPFLYASIAPHLGTGPGIGYRLDRLSTENNSCYHITVTLFPKTLQHTKQNLKFKLNPGVRLNSANVRSREAQTKVNGFSILSNERLQTSPILKFLNILESTTKFPFVARNLRKLLWKRH